MKIAKQLCDGYVGGSLDLRGCDLTGVTIPPVSGSLYLSGCDLKGVTIPAVGGSLYT